MIRAEKSMMKNYKKVLVVVGIAALVAVFFATGMHRYVTLENIKEQQASLQDLYGRKPFVVIAAFLAVYIPMVVLNLPGALVMGLAAGALFGTLAGTVIVSFASSIGATLACMLSRYMLRDWVQRRFGDKLKRVNAGISEEGAFYLFALRLMPVIPFFMINLVMGLTPIRLWTFYWVSQLGMLLGTAVFVNAGSQIARIDSLAGILSPGLIISLALLGIFPLVVRRGLTFFRNRHRQKTEVQVSTATVSVQSPPLELQKQIGDQCSECGDCVKSCSFLKHYGTPKSIAERFDFSLAAHQGIAYECSLCRLCAAVCPEKLDPASLFLEVRRLCCAAGNLDESKYGTMLGYERKGNSKLFSWYGLPEGCDTIFFPGCTLPGTRPEVTTGLFRQIRQNIPTLGLVLDCCTKPSHDLGRSAHFQKMFGEMLDYLVSQGVRTVLTACPNCTRVFRQYGHGVTVRTVYELLDAPPAVNGLAGNGRTFTVHDPCPLRNDVETQQAVRRMLDEMGLTVNEMKHRGKRTLCCGEGGTVAAVRPQWARAWALTREKESAGRTIVTYCAGCTGCLSRVVPTLHILDILFRQVHSQGKAKVAKAPFTYWHRLRLKRTMMRDDHFKVQRTRPAAIDSPSMRLKG
jgi:uncharacterized membrane protein YdjX (TVP38/TMEM64 family)/Fe-S oxidoreductase